MAGDAGRKAWGWRFVVIPALVAAALPATASAGGLPQQADDDPVLSVVTAYALEDPTRPHGGPSGTAVARFIHFADGTCDEALRIEVQGLSPAERYEVVMGGAPAAALTTDERGDAALVLPRPARSGGAALPAWLVPINRLGAITLRDSHGTVVLRGDLATAQRRVRALGAGGTLSD